MEGESLAIKPQKKLYSLVCVAGDTLHLRKMFWRRTAFRTRLIYRSFWQVRRDSDAKTLFARKQSPAGQEKRFLKYYESTVLHYFTNYM